MNSVVYERQLQNILVGVEYLNAGMALIRVFTRDQPATS
jgi:hypothetical protein